MKTTLIHDQNYFSKLHCYNCYVVLLSPKLLEKSWKPHTLHICSYLIKRNRKNKRSFGGLDNLQAKPNIFRCALRKPKSFIFGNTSQHAVSYLLQDAITVSTK